MRQFLFIIIAMFCLHAGAEVKIEKIFLKKKFAGYLVSNKFFKSVLMTPNQMKSDKYGSYVVRGGWIKSIILENSIDLLGSGKAPDGTIRYGLAQVFEPLVEIPEEKKELILPGVGRGTIDPKATLKITEFFPWKTEFKKTAKDGKNITVSFLQDCDNSKKELNYKMRIDCVFSDTTLVEIKGIFFNLSDKVLKARVSPTAIFNYSHDDLRPWIVVPYQQSRRIGNKRINYIDCNPIMIDNFHDYYEFTNERLSKAKRWIAIGGLKSEGVFSFISKAVIQKVVFWKTEDCFSMLPYVNLIANPKERVEWNWSLVVGKGMKSINNVTRDGVFGMRIKKYSRSRRYKCEMQYMPIKKTQGVILDVLLKSARGSILATKSYEMFDSSPLKPETIVMKMPKKVYPKRRYHMKLEMLKDDVVFQNSEQWIFPE